MGLLHTYQTGQTLAPLGGGSDGLPLGPFADWAALPASAQSGSLAFVSDLGPASSYGIARYDTGDAEWKLFFGYFLTLADLLTFTDPINSLAVATVGASLDDPESVRYQWDDSLLVPAWVRTPDGTEYIYAATDWANLPAQDTIQADDEAVVASLGLGNAYGRAVYDGTDWLLSRAWFDTVSDMTAFPEPKSVGALAAVEASASDDENAVRYQWNGSAWARTAALTAGYAWTLTETQLLDGTDPSGIGLVQEGDWGIFAASGGPIVVRYKVVTIAAGTTTGTRAMWIPPAAYAGTNLVLDSFALGTESDAQLVAQGLAVTEVPTGTVSSVGGYIRLDSPAGAGNPEARLNHATITGDKKWALMGQIRGTVTGAAAGLFQPFTEANSQYVLAHNAFSGLTSTVQQLYWVSSWTVASNTFTVRGGGSTWPASTPWLVMAESGTAISDPIETRVDGAVYSVFRRNSDGAVAGTNWTLTPQTVSGTGVSAQLELKNYFRLVWD